MSNAADRAAEWVYRGLWGVLVRHLRVPAEAPNVPPGAGDLVRSVRPALGFLSYLKFMFWIALIVIDVLIIGAWVVVLVINPLVGGLTAPLFWGVAILPDIVAYAALHVRYDTTWYIVTDRAVRIRRGVWIIRENTITFENVQNVEVRQGPVQRHFGISNLVVTTAGGGGAVAGAHGAQAGGGHAGLIEGVDNASALRELIMSRARASRGVGLGDDRHDERGAAWSSEHLAELRAIRDALGAA